MKIILNLSKRDLQFLDDYARESDLTRSAVVQKAVRLMREAELRAAYASAWEEWFETGDAGAWEATTGDGLAAT